MLETLEALDSIALKPFLIASRTNFYSHTPKPNFFHLTPCFIAEKAGHNKYLAFLGLIFSQSFHYVQKLENTVDVCSWLKPYHHYVEWLKFLDIYKHKQMLID